VKESVEKPAVDEAPSNVAISGHYIINLRIFDILARRSMVRVRDLVDGCFE